uniref:Putative conserved secreted protein n=1 Tax=Culex tarsalis TaxID=7177 RepID=A0A1Q3FKR4_CULTA
MTRSSDLSILVSFWLVLLVGFTCARARESGVPTGCVKILSVKCEKYLVGSTPWDVDRRNIALESAPEKWTVVKDGSYYRISSRAGSEDLYAFDKAGYDPESGKRQVFTWIPGFGESQGKWEIQEAIGSIGMYSLRNVHFDEYLYGSCDENLSDSNEQNKALTRKLTGNSAEMYLWHIAPC